MEMFPSVSTMKQLEPVQPAQLSPSHFSHREEEHSSDVCSLTSQGEAAEFNQPA